MSIKITVYDQQAQAVKDRELAVNIFGLTPNFPLIHQALTAQVNNQRQVLAHTKGRSEVRGGGRKPWKQKGTGRARAGSSRSPLWIGGGVTFGPTKDRNFKQKINKKMKQKALLMVLADKYKQTALVVIDQLAVNEFKTKQVKNILESLEKNVLKTERRSILIVDDNKNEKLKYSGRNLVGVSLINLENLNLVDLLKYRYLLLTESALNILEKRYTA